MRRDTETVERGEPDLIFITHDGNNHRLSIVKDGECQVWIVRPDRVYRLAVDGLANLTRHIKFEPPRGHSE